MKLAENRVFALSFMLCTLIWARAHPTPAAVSWLQLTPWPTSRALSSLAEGGGVVVAAGEVVVSSTDGVVWRVAPGAQNVSAVSWTGREFVALDMWQSAAHLSTDGRGWSTEQIPFSSRYYRGLGAAGDGAGNTVVAADLDPRRPRFALRRADGTWRLASSTANFEFRAMAWGADRFVVVGDDPTTVLLSGDGLSWTAGSLPRKGDEELLFRALEWCGDRFVALGDGSLFESTDGLSWHTLEPPPITGEYTHTYGLGCTEEEILVLGSGSGGGWSARQRHGLDWMIESFPVSYARDVASIDGRWLVLAGYPGGIYSKTGSQPWAALSTNELSDVESVASDGEIMVAVGDKVWTSRRGASWTPKQVPGWIGTLPRVSWTGDRWLLTSGTGEVLTSFDGASWRAATLPQIEGARYFASAGVGNRLVALGKHPAEPESEAFQLVSSDGESWQRAAVSVDLPLRAVCWAGERFVAVGDWGVIATSVDGTEWVQIEYPVPTPFAGVGYGGGRVVAVGGGTVASSSDLEVWRETHFTGGVRLSEVEWTGDRFVVAQGVRSDRMQQRLYTSSDGVSWEEIEGHPWGWISALTTHRGALHGFSSSIGVSVLRLEESDRPRGAPHQLVLPVATSSPGEQGTLWTSDLQLLSLDAEFVPFRIEGPPAGHGTTPPSAFLQLPPGGQMWREDLLGRTFVDFPPALALTIPADAPLLGSARVSTGNGNGSYGQRIPLLAEDDLVAASAPVILPLLASGPDFRTNLGLANLGSTPVEVEFELFDHRGLALGTLRLVAAPGGWVQRTRALEAVGAGEVEAAFARVTSFDPEARYYPYASVVDELSDDPSFVEPQTVGSRDLLIPAVAHDPGANGTLWRSDVDLVNPGGGPARVRLEALGAAVLTTPELELAAGTARRLADVVGGTLGAAGAMALRLVVLEGEIAVASRTYTVGAVGSFGQVVPALPLGEILGFAGAWAMPGLEQSARFRTNLGLVNSTAAPLEATVELYQGDGTLLGTLNRTVAPESLLQLNQPFALVWEHAVRGYMVVRSAEPGLAVWASVVDQGTGDPVFHPAVAIPAPSP